MTAEINPKQLIPYDADDSSNRWYAMKAFYNRVTPFKDMLTAAGYPVFVPMKPCPVLVDGVRKVKAVPAIPSLFFLKATAVFVRAFKFDYNDFLMYYPEPGTMVPSAINDKEMEMFQLVCKAPDDGLLFFPDNCFDFSEGQKVRVVDGIYKGAEGYIKRIKKDRRLLVRIEGVAVVATSFIHPSLLEPME